MSLNWANNKVRFTRIPWKWNYLTFYTHVQRTIGFPGGSVVKNLPAIQETQETWVQSLGQEDNLRRKWHPSPVFLLEKFHGQRSLKGYHPWGHKRVEPDLSTHEQRTILIPKLTEKYYNFTDVIPSLKILDFNSKGILQLYPLWNPIIITVGKKKKKITLPKLTCVMKCLSSHSQPPSACWPCRGGHCEAHQPKETPP